MQWTNVKLIFLREVRDQLRDRRTLFMIAVLPILLYPLLGMSFFQVSAFLRDHPSKVLIVGLPDLEGLPPLVDDGKFSSRWMGERMNPKLLEVTTEPFADVASAEEAGAAGAQIRRQVLDDTYEVALIFPADFRAKLDALRKELAERTGDAAPSKAPKGIARPVLYFNAANAKSRLAYERVSRVLRNWAEAVGRQNLVDANLPVAVLQPFEIADEDLAAPQQRTAAMWSKILPFVLLIWALTGAFYPAIDLCAGEKERGTLETLLSSPALRSEIVTGKLLTVMAFSVATSLLNLASMGITGALVISQLPMLEEASSMGLPPLAAFGWLALALIPVAALFSALCIALASFARSSKEGQYYLMPLVLVTLPLVILPMAPNVELNLGTSLIPVTGLVLLLRDVLEGSYQAVLPFVLPVVGVTLVCCVIAVRWAVDQFNKESVLFRESERLDLGLWLRHLRRDRDETPSVAEALFCGVLILLIRFFLGVAMADEPSHDEAVRSFVVQTVVMQLAAIATPALMMSIMLTRSPGKTLLLRLPKLWTLPGAMLLALALHPAMKLLQVAILQLYPMPEGPQDNPLKKLIELLQSGNNLFFAILLIAVLPAVCEELAFRGFILSGLRHLGRKWRAIALSSIIFGASHMILQQSIITSVVGAVAAYVAIQSGSIFPAMLFHFTHNATTVLSVYVLGNSTWKLRVAPYIQMIGESGAPEQDFIYVWWVFAFGIIIGGWLLVKFSDLSYDKTEEEDLEETIERRTVELNA